MAHIHATRPPRVFRSALRTNAGVLAKEYALILLGAILYGLSTILFVFPHKLLLGGTSGIAVILADLLPLTAGEVSVTLNITLIVVAFFVLGKGMAIKTFFGSLFTTIAIGLFEKILPVKEPPIANIYLSALAGAAVLHDLPLALRFADRVAVLDGGRLIALGTPEEIMSTDILQKTFGVRIFPVSTPLGTHYVCG